MNQVSEIVLINNLLTEVNSKVNQAPNFFIAKEIIESIRQVANLLVKLKQTYLAWDFMKTKIFGSLQKFNEIYDLFNDSKKLVDAYNKKGLYFNLRGDIYHSIIFDKFNESREIAFNEINEMDINSVLTNYRQKLLIALFNNDKNIKFLVKASILSLNNNLFNNFPDGFTLINNKEVNFDDGKKVINKLNNDFKGNIKNQLKVIEESRNIKNNVMSLLKIFSNISSFFEHVDTLFNFSKERLEYINDSDDEQIKSLIDNINLLINELEPKINELKVNFELIKSESENFKGYFEFTSKLISESLRECVWKYLLLRLIHETPMKVNSNQAGTVLDNIKTLKIKIHELKTSNDFDSVRGECVFLLRNLESYPKLVNKKIVTKLIKEITRLKLGRIKGRDIDNLLKLAGKL